jgi:hypothetical protein
MSEDRPSLDNLEQFFDAVHSPNYVSGHTHNFYRYPARFSPLFARAALQAFTKPGDTVFDPFMGGGTTAVESLISGRRFIGSDINPLSHFVTKVKTTPLSRNDLMVLNEWADSLASTINLHRPIARHLNWARYQQHLPWWLRKTLEMALDSADGLPKKWQQRFGRCSLLRTAQWALDSRQAIPKSSEFLEVHRRNVASMLDAAHAFGRQVGEAFGVVPSRHYRFRRLLCRTASGMELDERIERDWLPPRLVLTSPPYVGIHVLYHRWQVQGRRETPAPYWLADCKDGHGGSHYTFGDHRRDFADRYKFDLKASFQSVAAMIDEQTLVVQLVAFSKPEEQLEPYLEVLRSVGLMETDVCGFAGSFERVWRIVPNRKWYASIKGNLPARNLVRRCSNGSDAR